MRFPVRIVALAMLSLAACERAAPEPVETAAATAPAPANTATATATTKPKVAHNAVVDASGVALGKNPGTAQRFAFEAPRAQVDAAATKWLGEPQDRSRNEECGAGPMEFSRYGGLTLNFQDGKLAGWMLEEEPRAVTSDGIRPGAFLRDLRVTRSVQEIPDSTLEGEFEYVAADGETIGGFAKGKGHDARIASLYAGLTCFFR